MTTSTPDNAHEGLEGLDADIVRPFDVGNIESHTRLAIKHRGDAVHRRLGLGDQGAVEGNRAPVMSPVELHPQERFGGTHLHHAQRPPSRRGGGIRRNDVSRRNGLLPWRNAAGERARPEEESRDRPTGRDCGRPPECGVVAMGDGESVQRAMASELARDS